jgi:integrase
VRSGKDQKSVRTLLLDAPKNTKSHGKAPAALRNVFLIPELAQDLREWRLRSPRSDDNDLVFITRGSDCKGTKPGRVLTATNWRRDFLTPACIAAEIKPITWHDLRHFFATIAFERFPENYVRVTELLGHEQIQTTLDHYKGWHDKTGRMKEDGAAFQQILQR